MELTVQPLNRTIQVSAGTNLLAALREQGIPVSYSCTAGRCGTCRCRVLRGEVIDTGREARISSLNEDGYVLACTSLVDGDCTIEIAEPDEIVHHPARILKATVSSIDAMTHDILRLRLSSAKPLEFSPGQYAMLQFTPQHIRPYSMAGLTGDRELEFHVRLVPDGRVSRHIAQQLRIGDAVRVSGPLGTAYLRRKHEGPMLCVAGGTGLAPVLSIVRGALEAGMKNDIHLYFGVRSPRDIYCAERIAELAQAHRNLHAHIVVASSYDDPRLRSGLVTDAVAQDFGSLAGFRAYFCGAPAMVDAATLMAKSKGIAPEHLHADAFHTNVL